MFRPFGKIQSDVSAAGGEKLPHLLSDHVEQEAGVDR